MPRTITLGSVTMRCLDELPAGLLFDLVEAEPTNAGTVAAYGRFLRAIVEDSDKEKLETALYDKKKVVPYYDVEDSVRALIREYTTRPTERLSDSPPGTEPTEQPSRVVSLSPDMDKAQSKSQKDGRLAAS